jgi:hypothetical protein
MTFGPALRGRGGGCHRQIKKSVTEASRSGHVVAITWKEKQISTLLCDQIHDDYIAAILSKNGKQTAANLFARLT